MAPRGLLMVAAATLLAATSVHSSRDTTFRLMALNRSAAVLNATDGKTHGTFAWTPRERFVFDDDLNIHGRLRVEEVKNARLQRAQGYLADMLECNSKMTLYDKDSGECRPVAAKYHNTRIKDMMTGIGYYWCVIMGDDTYRCWGHGAHYGNFGNGLNDGNANRYLPTENSITLGQPLQSRRLNSRYRMLPAAWTAYNQCVARRDGTVWCLGYGGYGNLGYGGTSTYYYWRQASYLENVSAVVAGGANTYSSFCALEGEGTLWCWGYNGNGQCGVGHFNSVVSSPSEIIPLGSGVKQLDMSWGAAHSSTCAVKKDDTIYCWGWNEVGQLANGGTSRRDTPSQVSANTEEYLKNVDYMKFHGQRYSTAFALTKDGHIWAWGYNSHGQTGSGDTAHRKVAYPVIDDEGQQLTGMRDIHVCHGSRYGPVCAISQDGFVYCWGYNNQGALGQGHTSTKYKANKVHNVEDAETIVNVDMFEGSPYYHSVCAITKTDRDVWCWGANQDGQQGIGTTSNPQSRPNKVYNVRGIAGKLGSRSWAGSDGDTSMYMVSEDGYTLYMWGYNGHGQSGVGQTWNPVRIPTASRLA